ncbi:MAG: hypothetical protein AABY22_11660 [Nanoarchaeota archaeon]
MAISTTIIQIIIGFIFTVVVIWAIIYFFKKPLEEIQKDLTIVESICPELTKGYSSLLLEKSEELSDNKKRLTLIPRDLGQEDEKEDELKKVIVNWDKSCILEFPRGTWSANRNKIWLVPVSANDMPKALYDSTIGKAIALGLESTKMDKSMSDLLFKVFRRYQILAERVKAGEVTDELVGEMKGLFEQFKPMAQPQKPEDFKRKMM